MAKNKDSFTGNSEFKFEEILSNIEQWFNKNQKILTISVVAVIAVVGIVLGYKYLYQMPLEEEAADNVFYAQRMIEVDSLNLALNGDGNHVGFLEIIDNYSGTDAANIAKFYVGVIYLKQGQYEDAIEYLERFKAHGDLFLAPLSQSLLGDAYAESGDNETALKCYDKAIKCKKNDVVIPDILVKAATLCDISGDYKKALSYYETLRKDYIGTQQAQNADKFIAMLEEKMK
ncbi:hypothetical protein FACS1894153_1990 [Bacteroidia bacterium]|nr:hypothetical protein FACS1894153_1990 [Bacteroidia bacterium]